MHILLLLLFVDNCCQNFIKLFSYLQVSVTQKKVLLTCQACYYFCSLQITVYKCWY